MIANVYKLVIFLYYREDKSILIQMNCAKSLIVMKTKRKKNGTMTIKNIEQV
jgi:hypothetical protein